MQRITTKGALYGAAVALSGLVAVAAFISPTGAWPLASLALACVAAANIDRFQEISAGTSGIKAVVREAKTELANLRDVVEVMSEFHLSAIQQMGRFASDDDSAKAESLRRLTDLMRKAGLPDSRIAEIKKAAWDPYVIYDYVLAITGYSIVPDTTDVGVERRWRDLRSFERPATPDQVETFLNEVGDEVESRRELLKSYRHYLATGDHLTAEIWSRRRDVPRVFHKKT